MIKSSFKKVDKKTEDTNKAYFGHPELDAIFGNTLKKGHLLIIEEDQPTTLYAVLIRYFVGSSVRQSHVSIVYDQFSHARWQSIIPEPTKESSQKPDPSQPKSQIAWRYDNMDIKLNHLPVAEDAVYLDLAKNVPVQKARPLVHTNNYPSQNNPQTLFESICYSLQSSMKDSNDNKLKKLALVSLPGWVLKHHMFHKFMVSLKCLIRSSHVVALITVSPSHERAYLESLVGYADYYLKVNGKLGQAYQHFAGSISILKQVEACSIKTNNRGPTVWGIKNKHKRELRIQSLYQDTLKDNTQQAAEGASCSKKMQEKLDF